MFLNQLYLPQPRSHPTYGTAVHMIQCTVWHATSSGHAMPMGYRQDRGDGGGIAAVLRNGEQLTGRVTNNQITTT